MLLLFRQLGRKSDLEANVTLIVRRADIPFYREHRLYEILARRDTAATYQQYYFLRHSSGSVRPLYGDSQAIHQTNRDEAPILSTASAAADYLRFFCWAVRGADGPFLIVEHFRDIPWERAPQHDARENVMRHIQPIQAARRSSEGADHYWHCSATVLYGRHLFSATFSVSDSGRVEMPTDVPVRGELPVTQFHQDKLTIEKSLTDSHEPITYLDEFTSATPGEPLDCSPEQFLAKVGVHDGDTSR